MFNILPHKYQKIAMLIIFLTTMVPSYITFFYPDFHFPERIGHLGWAIAIIMWFVSRDKYSDEFLDSLKLKSMSVVFILSAVFGFLFSDFELPLHLAACYQLIAYAITLFLFKKNIS